MRRPSLRALRVLALAAVLGVTGCTPSDPSPPATANPTASATGTVLAPDTFTPVVQLITERLDLGVQVAAAKWFSGAPIEDPVRELAVLENARVLARQGGGDQFYAEHVFAAQIEASKVLQQALMDAWKAGTEPVPASAPDLTGQVRPELDRITHQLVSALRQVEQFTADPGCADAVAASLAATIRPAIPGGEEALAVALASLCATVD